MYKRVANKSTGSAGSFAALERCILQVFSVMPHISPPVVGSNVAGIQKKSKKIKLYSSLIQMPYITLQSAIMKIFFGRCNEMQID